MPNWINPQLALLALTFGAILLTIGLRGVRLDRDPRCRARRCRYPLRELLDAKQRANEPQWPITCPECGRVMESESRAKRGARKKLRPLIALGLILALPSLGALSLEGYARWHSVNARSTMPVWLLLHLAERDGAHNGWPHQREILSRVHAGALQQAEAEQIAERILVWQRDPSRSMTIAGDIFCDLIDQTLVTPRQLDLFWEQSHRFELLLPSRAAGEGPLPFAIRTERRVGERIPFSSPYASIYGPYGLDGRDAVFIERIAINGKKVPLDGLDPHLRTLFTHPGGREAICDRGFLTHDPAWALIRTPAHNGSRATIEVDIRWFVESPKTQTLVTPFTGAPQADGSYTRKLAERGLPTTRAVTLRGEVSVAPAGALTRPVDSSPRTRRFLETWVKTATLEVPDKSPYDGASIVVFTVPREVPPPPTAHPVFLADAHLRQGDFSVGLTWTDTILKRTPQTLRVTRRADHDRLHALVHANPEGWELVITPRPDLAAHVANDLPVFAGEPIVVPLTLRIGGDISRRSEPPMPE